MAPLPAPASRVPAALYAEARAFLIANDPDGSRMLEWATNDVRPPETPEAMALEVIWVILCAGRSAQAARTIERRVLAAIRAGRPALEGFGYRAKADAIDAIWRDRGERFEELSRVVAAGDPEALLDWCGSLRFVGDDTKFQLARNFGADVCKPDIWLCRLAGIPDRPRLPLRRRFPPCMALCAHLAEASGDRIGAVDAMLWLACNKGVIRVGPDAGQVSFCPGALRERACIVS